MTESTAICSASSGGLRLGTALALAGAAPFLAGRLLSPGGGRRRFFPCPLKLVTGIPCPMCGATRSFAYAARRDARYRDGNAVWVYIAAAFLSLGTLHAVGRGPKRLGGPVPDGDTLLRWSVPLFVAGWLGALRRGL